MKTVNTLNRHVWTTSCSKAWVNAPPVVTSVSKNDTWSVSYGDNLPDWKARIAEGRNASTLLLGTRTLRYGKVGSAKYYQHGLGPCTIDGVLLHQNLADTVPACGAATVSRATTDAAVQFTKHFRKNTEQWRSGEFLGTLVQTARLVHEPALLLRKGITGLYSDLIRAVKRAGGTGIPLALLRRRQREALAEAWLLWSFGISPTIKDLNDACTAARALASNRNFDIVRLKGEGHAETHLGTSSNVAVNAGSSGFSGSSLAYERTDFEVSNVTYRGAWKTSNPNGELPVPQHFGLKLNEVIPTAWELVPWSFFADYFTNIGDVLDAWNVALVDFAWLNRTTRSRRTARFSDVYRKSPQPSDLDFISASGGRAYVSRYDVRRDPLSSLLDARFRIDLQIPSLTKLLNIAALTQMRVRPKGLFAY